MELFELQPKSSVTTPRDKIEPFVSSGFSLRAKAFSVDGARIFIGSFNFEPRSITSNTEMGLLIDSAAMAHRTHDAFDRKLSGVAWDVILDRKSVCWKDTQTDTGRSDEPASTLFNRAALTVIG